MTTPETAKEIGTRIGLAIANDTLLDLTSRRWVGLRAEDVDQIPDGMDFDEVEGYAAEAYYAAISAQ